MDSLGNLATAIVAEASRASPQSSNAPTLPTRRDGPLPARFDRETDLDIPRRVFSNWIPSVGPREIVRPLSDDERSKLKRRAAELQIALEPYQTHERNGVGIAIASMLGGFRSMRQEGEDALAMAESIAMFLAPFPAWAIREACAAIRAGEAQCDPPLDRRFPPNDNQIRDVVKNVVRTYRRALDTAEALLQAPVERQAEPAALTREQIEAKLGRPLQARPPSGMLAPVREWPASDGKHMERVAADLEARRARREQEQPGENVA